MPKSIEIEVDGYYLATKDDPMCEDDSLFTSAWDLLSFCGFLLEHVPGSPDTGRRFRVTVEELEG